MLSLCSSLNQNPHMIVFFGGGEELPSFKLSSLRHCYKEKGEFNLCKDLLSGSFVYLIHVYLKFTRSPLAHLAQTIQAMSNRGQAHNSMSFYSSGRKYVLNIDKTLAVTYYE